MRSFWFGKELPASFRDPAVQDNLSFNGQIHFKCSSCDRVYWADVTLARTLLSEHEKSLPCSTCRRKKLGIVTFKAFESRVCQNCGSQQFEPQERGFDCAACHKSQFFVNETLIDPSYPTKLFVLLERKEPFGLSPEDDTNFLVEYVRGLRSAPQFHENCIHLVTFVESLFMHVYGATADAANLLNLASSLMRTVYKETGNPDAGFLSIAMMMEGRDLATNPIQRAVFGLNINQNVYSVLARRGADLLAPRFDFNLKDYGVWLSHKTLAELEAIGEDFLAQLRAQQKWLLGDILKSLDPSDEEIDEALQWFDAALKDPAFPAEMAGFVTESALTAQAKRKDMTKDERERVRTSLTKLTADKLDKTDGIQRIQSLTELLRGASHRNAPDERRELANQCLGEAIVYVASNNPKSILRHSGTIISRLPAGFAAERFEAGYPLEGIAGVEAFRSLSIERGNLSPTLGHHVHDLEAELLLKKALMSEREDPKKVGERILAMYHKSLKGTTESALIGDADRAIFWFELWEGRLFTATLRIRNGKVEVKTEANDALDADIMRTLKLPMAFVPPSRLRARQVETALRSGWALFRAAFEGDLVDISTVVVGPSALGSWPIDAAEALHATNSSGLRSVTFSPSIHVAPTTHNSSKQRSVSKMLIIPYGGEDLPGTIHEVEGLAALYGEAATVLDVRTLGKKEVVNELARDYDVIHFCGHGEFDYITPLRSRIYFHTGKGEDGVLTAEDILQCGTIGKDPIIVLSACTSAMVLPNGSNNFLGLAGSLLRTGATAIVGARWPISDEVAAAFSISFHERLLEGHSAPDAVALAKESLQCSRIDEWTAFMCIGG